MLRCKEGDLAYISFKCPDQNRFVEVGSFRLSIPGRPEPNWWMVTTQGWTTEVMDQYGAKRHMNQFYMLDAHLTPIRGGLSPEDIVRELETPEEVTQ